MAGRAVCPSSTRWTDGSGDAPRASFQSQHPRFAGSLITGGFCSNLESRIQQWKPDLWIHGHVHDPMDYRIGKTRILCNPWGHPNEGRERAYRIVEV